METSYQQFLAGKAHLSGSFGFTPTFLPDRLFPFQRAMASWLIQKGRGAGFADTGLGKTGLELTVAYNIVLHTNRPVLILTPLAVAFQFIKEAALLGIDDIEYSRDGRFTKKIIVTNYERLHLFSPADFEGLVLDESSILKNFQGKIKAQITGFIKQLRYRFLFTATPSPNDHIELGTSSEALGYMGYMDMLTRFFANNENNIRPQDIGTKFYLKPHASDEFFRWVSSWSLSVRKPSDMGDFDDSAYQLPDLLINRHAVRNERNWISQTGQLSLFANVATRQSEVLDEQRSSVVSRCEKAVELTQGRDCSVYWCNLNAEGDLLAELDSDAQQLTGSMSLDQKEELLLAFADGWIKKLITKPKMTAFGLNWQHCSHTVYFPTFSYEQFYQSLKRFHRFGQARSVTCDLVYSDGQKRVLDALSMKTGRADELYSQLRRAKDGSFADTIIPYKPTLNLPSFLTRVA